MTAFNYLSLFAIGLALAGWGTHAYAEGDVTIVKAPAATGTAAKKKASTDTAAVHKSSHKKKSHHSATAKTPVVPDEDMDRAADTASGASSASPSPTGAGKKSATASTTPASAAVFRSKVTPSATSFPQPTPISPSSDDASTPISPSASGSPISAAGPTVETGLPVARHAATVSVMGMIPIPPLAPASSGWQSAGAGRMLNSPLQSSSPTLPAASFGSFAPVRTTPPPAPVFSGYAPARMSPPPKPDFAFTNFDKHAKNIYPWKTNIVTTMFWIGEGGSSISSTDNVSSAWDIDWRDSNRGNDSPYQRNGYAPADHAPTVNPFYVALPFNDMVYPEKTRQYLPPGWHRPPGRDGKPVSACKDRWVEIKTQQGHICYAQWEDVGPLRFDDAEYVFGNERPTDAYSHAGLDVSPAVAQYLGIDGNNRYTSWRFVDDDDVVPGAWLKYDELAVVFKAIHEQKNAGTSSYPIQGSSEPIDDAPADDANKKKVDAAKG